jgi:hypothetical protein
MAAPTFVAVGTWVTGTGNVIPGIPSGTTTDDILILAVNSYSGDAAVSAPSGYASVTNSPSSTSDPELAVFWKRAGGSESAPTVTDVGEHLGARLFCFRGCIGSGNPWDITAAGNSSTFDSSVTFPSVTTTVSDTLILNVHAGSIAGTGMSGYTNANLTSITERGDSATLVDLGGGSSVWVSVTLATGIKTTTGSTGSTTATVPDSTKDAMMTIALKSGSTPTNAPGGTGTATNATNAAKSAIGASAQNIG